MTRADRRAYGLRIAVAASAPLLAVWLSACGATPAVHTGGTQPSASATPKATPKATAKATPSGNYTVGQTMVNGANQKVTVTSVTQNTAPSAYSTPSPGDQCLEVQVSIYNGDSSPWTEPLLELSVIDASGQSYDSLSSFDCQTSSSIDSLVPGGHATAVLYFEVPSTGKLTLQWTPNIFNPNSNYNTLLEAS